MDGPYTVILLPLENMVIDGETMVGAFFFVNIAAARSGSFAPHLPIFMRAGRIDDPDGVSCPCDKIRWLYLILDANLA